ncbi:hypothetical protein C8046_04330 [Serinibacter arcticus]|uniref:HNH nuclease domain-containing protein n=1 Tax=Serinibacter arcticus TaxID=1655435 RepID=A0A2U1ZSQ7_9MICO|nr:HNH endonuclease signature motif containing protein [Serinibacter arcticus]PWD50017.1 hypothetical protein C8046_04330 [Serinibacter arcticus]
MNPQNAGHPPDPGTELITEGYTPSAALARKVRQAHPTCVAPSCTVPSTACDLDHVVPWPLGPTSEGNLRPLCRRHHLLKTHLGHTLAVDPTGAAIWTTPTGHRYLRPFGGESRLIVVPARRRRGRTRAAEELSADAG